MQSKRIRQTNAQRSAATRAKLLSATEECLIEYGYARTTTKEVCQRAGVSNGSLLHHYRTRSNLLAATLENLYSRLSRRIEEATTAAKPGSSALSVFVDQLFAIFDEPAMKAMIELWLASANDPQLHQRVFPVMQDFADGIPDLVRRCLPELSSGAEKLDHAIRFILITLQGYALALIAFGRRQPDEAEVRRFLRERVHQLLDELEIE